MAQADSVISQSLSDLPTNVDLNDFDAWAYYADTTAGLFNTVSNTSPTTNDPNSAAFSALSGNSSVMTDYGYSQNMYVTYSGGTGGANPAAESSPGVDNYDFTVGGLTMSTQLIATTETLHFYLYAWDAATNLSLSYGNHVDELYTDEVLPEVVNGDASGSGDNIGELTVTVQGSIGDTFTFKALTTEENVSDGGSTAGGTGHVGLEAVTVDAIPEPSTYAMMFLGLGAVGLCVRRKLA